MKRWTMCLLLGLLLLLGSCSTAAEKGGYQLYFASGLEDGSAILSEPYQGEADPGPRELMEALLSGPTEEELNSPFPSGVSLRSWGLEEGAVSYTHLDVYKRQPPSCPTLPESRWRSIRWRSLTFTPQPRGIPGT